ncbi:hypothetical protein HRbin36_00369 [bacterium HR36]|nr:hypothetical protein HRbin36_00369 [bacterium HR36]
MPRREPARLHLERLEERCQPAGTVSVVQVGGIVRLLGDAADNAVALEATGANDLTITGLAGTSISGPTSVSGVARVYFELGDGNDSATVEAPVPFDGQIVARASKGSDSFSIGNGQYNGSIVVLEGNGNDAIELQSGTFNGAIILWGNSGNDTLTVGSSSFARRFEFSGGHGADSVTLDSSTFADRVVLHTDDGNDLLTITSSSFSTFALFDLGSSNDKANLDTVTFPTGKPRSVILGNLGVDTITQTGVSGSLIVLGFFP